MERVRSNPAARCEARWIGWTTLVLGGASLALSGFDDLGASLLARLGLSALIGFVLSWIFCPARAGRNSGSGSDGSGSDGSGWGSGDGTADGCDGGDGGGCDGGGGDGGGGE